MVAMCWVVTDMLMLMNDLQKNKKKTTTPKNDTILLNLNHEFLTPFVFLFFSIFFSFNSDYLFKLLLFSFFSFSISFRLLH